MPKNIYPIPGTVEESERLVEQGLIFEDALGYRIHPAIATRLPSSPHIADIGTNSGDYLVRLAKEYPADSAFYGFDISPASFYSEDKLPTNVKLHVQDIREPFPSQFHGKFDLLHLRLLVAGLKEHDWAVAVKNLAELLRPGGAIQWEENDVMSSRILRGGKPGSSIKNLERCLYPLRENFRDRFMFGHSQLPGLLEGVGLVGVEQDILSNDRAVANRERQAPNVIEAVMHWAKSMDQETRLRVWSGFEVQELARKAYEDVENGAYWRFDIFVTIGFKPE